MACSSLLEVLHTVPDTRSRRGQSYPLSAVLALMVLGMLMGRRSLAGIARLNADYQGDLALLLGFPRRRTPTLSGLSRILQHLNIKAFEQVLSQWIQQATVEFTAAIPNEPDAPAEPLPLHIDGKTLCGSRIPEAELPGVHLVAAFAPSVQAVLAQIRVDAKTNEHKAALELLKLLPARPGGHLISGDAMFCQKDLCQAIIDRGDDYLLVVKDNQPSLVTDINAGLTFAATARTFSPGRPSGSASAL
jgi:hypothetical protein